MTDNFFDLTNPNFLGIIWRFIINVVFLFILLRYVYFRYSRKEKYLFSFFLMGIMAFFVTSIMNKVFMAVGMSVGLFAIFGILRLRATNFTAKDMAYTFATFGVSVINGLQILNFPLLGILLINGIIVLSAYVLEKYTSQYKTESHAIVMEKLELLKPERKEKLLKELSEMTGKEIIRFKINKINYRRKRALLDVFYKE